VEQKPIDDAPVIFKPRLVDTYQDSSGRVVRGDPDNGQRKKSGVKFDQPMDDEPTVDLDGTLATAGCG
jgi:hypothetical protein